MNSVLFKKNILLTRSENQIDSELDEFIRSGVNLILFPTIKIKELYSPKSLINNSNDFEYIILTSVNAAKIFISKLSEYMAPSELKAGIVTVGGKTKEFCEKNYLCVKIVPEKDFSAAGIVKELQKLKLNRKKIFIPCSKLAGSELPDKLTALGAVVSVEYTYTITLPEKHEVMKAKLQIKNTPPDVYMFTSPSTFRNFADILSVKDVAEYFKGKIVAAIGTTTKSAIESAGVNVQITPDVFTIDSMLKKTEEFFVHLQG